MKSGNDTDTKIDKQQITQSPLVLFSKQDETIMIEAGKNLKPATVISADKANTVGSDQQSLSYSSSNLLPSINSNAMAAVPNQRNNACSYFEIHSIPTRAETSDLNHLAESNDERSISKNQQSHTQTAIDRIRDQYTKTIGRRSQGYDPQSDDIQGLVHESIGVQDVPISVLSYYREKKASRVTLRPGQLQVDQLLRAVVVDTKSNGDVKCSATSLLTFSGESHTFEVCYFSA